jgi:hypothetical protein
MEQGKHAAEENRTYPFNSTHALGWFVQFCGKIKEPFAAGLFFVCGIVLRPLEVCRVRLLFFH